MSEVRKGHLGIGLSNQIELNDAIRPITTVGDSFMAGNGGASLQPPLAVATLRTIYNTGVGGSSLGGVKSRILDPANAGLRMNTTVLWDGSENGYTNPLQYVGLMLDALSCLYTSQVIVIPPMTLYGDVTALARKASIRDEMLVRFPGAVLDWRNVLPNDNGQLAAEYYVNPGSDTTHPSQLTHNLMAQAIADMLVAKGW